MGRRSVVIALLLVGVLVGACGSEPSAPEAIPAAALPGSAAEPVELDAAAVSVDAIDVTGLEALLEDAGFIAGTQRLFSRTQPGRRRTLARVLAFETPEGAARYLTWLKDHVDEVIGDAESSSDLAAPAGGSVYVHEPDPCCHSETRVFLAMWKDGSRVITLEVGGQAARSADVPELISTLDAAV